MKARKYPAWLALLGLVGALALAYLVLPWFFGVALAELGQLMGYSH
jgi:hypothetical protein